MSAPPGPWPTHFPPGVPPDVAVPAAGPAYRLVRAVPSAQEDFQSLFERRPRDYGSMMWLACGVSFHRDLDDSRRVRLRYPPLRSRRIAVGELKNEIGVMLPTPSKEKSHLTVWVRHKAVVHPSFTVDAELV